MSTVPAKAPVPETHQGGFPWSHVVGYLLSLVLTIGAFALVFRAKLSFHETLFVILFLAVLQILVQLLFFMHVTERHGPSYHMMMFGLAMFFVFVIVGASIWIMSFGSMVS